MFTGIIETTGEIRAVTDEEGGRRVEVAADLDGLAHGQSIAIDGTCLTVEKGRREPAHHFFTSVGSLHRPPPVGLAEAGPQHSEHTFIKSASRTGLDHP